jgi:hypothetical protein
MYHTQDEFERAIRASDPPYTDHDLASIELAWEVYQAALGQSHVDSLVLGRKVGPHFAGLGIDDVLRANFRTINQLDNDGAILQMADDEWTYLVNDSWVLGGVHAHKPFYIASERTPDNIYSVNYDRLTVTARELTGLKVFGYVIQHRQGLGEVAVCVDTDLADMASFEAYNEYVVLYATNEGWMAQLLAPDHGGPAVVTIN